MTAGNEVSTHLNLEAVPSREEIRPLQGADGVNSLPTSIPQQSFLHRHLGPSAVEQQRMLQTLNLASMEELLKDAIPSSIRLPQCHIAQSLPPGVSEQQALTELETLMGRNRISRSLVGLGYFGAVMPAVIRRNVLENPAWLTAYTPYQAEIAQGRLEALLNFQTLISELTGLPVANASLLDEATAVAEAMGLSFVVCKRPQARRFLVDQDIYPQTMGVLRTRAEPLGIQLDVKAPSAFVFDEDVFGVLLQLPDGHGRLWDPTELISAAHHCGALVTVAVDPLAQVLMAPVGTLGVDVAVGSAQRLGLPLGYGGPHAAFFATRENYKRQVPGRIVGLSVDAEGRPALRLALQTREQHIRRDKATSNICTAQVLLAVLVSFYAVYHGAAGLKAIARRVRHLTQAMAAALAHVGLTPDLDPGFDTIVVETPAAADILKRCRAAGFSLRVMNDDKKFALSLDERSTVEELEQLLALIAPGHAHVSMAELLDISNGKLPVLERHEPWLQQEPFHKYRSETALLRYIQKLAAKDFSLIHGMIPLGSCTMKLNAAAELLPLSWPSVGELHPFAPAEDTQGYGAMIRQLQDWLAELTGFDGVSLQPNAGSQGELAGLLVIRAWQASRGQAHRRVCLIPTSAHGTNPASAVMAGLQVVPVSCDSQGNIDLEDLHQKATIHSHDLAALMVTYPSTHGVFEAAIQEICAIIHDHGGQIYLDGANLNAQLELCRPGDYGADVCHLNLHKSFCIPHGGGGPGVGPIAVAAHLVPFLPSHPLLACGGEQAIGPVSAAPFGSASILTISWMYLRMMGAAGLRQASTVAILNANYIAHRLEEFYPVLFRGEKGRVAHECILDLRPLRSAAGVGVEDVAKRLMDYGFHAPTVSWPVAGTMMVEPTESENKAELDRFCDAMIAVRQEVDGIASGAMDRHNNPLKRAPHTIAALTADTWDRPYSRQQGGLLSNQDPAEKLWPAVARIDNARGDRTLICTCPSVESYAIQSPDKGT